MLDLKIKTFLTVCDTMNFTKASEKLHITQPAVSQHIHALEKEYNTKLFKYQGKKLKLTLNGDNLKQATLTMQNDLLKLKNEFNKTIESEHLKFGATQTVGEFKIPPILIEYLSKNKTSNICVTISDTKEILKQLDNGKIDFAIIEGSFTQSQYSYMKFSNQKYIAVCGKNYTFKKNVIKIEDLLEERLLVREKGSGTRHILDIYLEHHNLSIDDFHLKAEINNISLIKSLVKANCGITFIYEIAVKKELSDGIIKNIPIKELDLTHDFSFIWRKNSLYSDKYREIFNLFKSFYF